MLEVHHASAAEQAASLPGELSLLVVGPEEPSWTLLTLQLDRLGCTTPRFRWCSTAAEAVRAAGVEPHDVMILDDSTGGSDVRLDAFETVGALRAAGWDEPVLLLSDRVDDEWLEEAACLDVELLVTCRGWRSRAVARWIARAIERHSAAQARKSNESARRSPESFDRDECEQLMEDRRALADRAANGENALSDAVRLTPESRASYLELLRSCAIVGPASLGSELGEMAAQMRGAGATAGDLLRMHVEALPQLVAGLGARSAKHVVQRADFLLMELLVRLQPAGNASPAELPQARGA